MLCRLNPKPDIFIASAIEAPSSAIVGKNLKITEKGMMISLGMCSFSMAATNSLTLVVNMNTGMSLWNVIRNIPKRYTNIPPIYGITYITRSVNTKYIKMEIAASLIFLLKMNNELMMHMIMNGSMYESYLWKITMLKINSSRSLVLGSKLNLESCFKPKI